MGMFNSSINRIQPLARFVGDDKLKLGSLFELVTLDGNPSMKEIQITQPITAMYADETNGKKEKALRPPMDHLIWMVQNFEKCRANKNGSTETKTNREFLRMKDDLKISEACSRIKSIYSTDSGISRKWFILEGATYPDLFFETEDLIAVIEGKWTEAAITGSTTFLEYRNQMARHIQGGLEYNRTKYNGRKSVAGFYIVDENFLHKNEGAMTSKGFSEELDKETVPIKNKQEILDCYKGFTTWQAIERESAFAKVRFPSKNEIPGLNKPV